MTHNQLDRFWDEVISLPNFRDDGIPFQYAQVEITYWSSASMDMMALNIGDKTLVCTCRNDSSNSNGWDGWVYSWNQEPTQNDLVKLRLMLP